MNLARQAISATAPTQIIDVRFDADAHVFSCSTPSGFAVYRSWPLQLLKKRGKIDFVSLHLRQLFAIVTAYHAIWLYLTHYLVDFVF
jgi:hypothetical protein